MAFAASVARGRTIDCSRLLGQLDQHVAEGGRSSGTCRAPANHRASCRNRCRPLRPHQRSRRHCSLPPGAFCRGPGIESAVRGRGHPGRRRQRCDLTLRPGQRVHRRPVPEPVREARDYPHGPASDFDRARGCKFVSATTPQRPPTGISSFGGLARLGKARRLTQHQSALVLRRGVAYRRWRRQGRTGCECR